MAQSSRRRRATSLRPWQIRRLVAYYHFLRVWQVQNPGKPVSSARLAEPISVDDTQVRKDLAAIGVKGSPRIGFDADAVVEGIRATFGFDEGCPAVIIGSGRVGGAIASYKGFSHYGLTVVAMFDKNPEVIGTQVGPCNVQDVACLEEVIAQTKARLAIITTPSTEAQNTAQRLVEAGVSAIWNFAPVQLSVPRHVVVLDQHLSGGLAELSYYLKRGHRKNG